MTFSGAPSFLSGASQCTANFVFTDSTGAVYLGQAAHCSENPNAPAGSSGCDQPMLPLGTAVYTGNLVNGVINNGTLIGTVAYNSWNAMQSQSPKETDPNLCAFNDLALIRINSAEAGSVNPTVPFWGGPTGLAPAVGTAGSTVFGYGNSVLRGGVTLLSPKTGVNLGDIDGTNGWEQSVYTVTPGLPGDSGSGYMDSSGNALGQLSYLQGVPPAGNGVGVLAKELAYANSVTGAGYQLATGTTRFSAIPLPPAPGALRRLRLSR
jgi:hypothetical protein